MSSSLTSCFPWGSKRRRDPNKMQLTVELANKIEKAFDKVDIDKSGEVEYDEALRMFSRFKGLAANKLLEDMDLDGDKIITRQEWFHYFKRVLCFQNHKGEFLYSEGDLHDELDLFLEGETCVPFSFQVPPVAGPIATVVQHQQSSPTGNSLLTRGSARSLKMNEDDLVPVQCSRSREEDKTTTSAAVEIKPANLLQSGPSDNNKATQGSTSISNKTTTSNKNTTEEITANATGKINAENKGHDSTTHSTNGDHEKEKKGSSSTFDGVETTCNNDPTLLSDNDDMEERSGNKIVTLLHSILPSAANFNAGTTTGTILGSALGGGVAAAASSSRSSRTSKDKLNGSGGLGGSNQQNHVVQNDELFVLEQQRQCMKKVM
ncbi:unnamed protein product [Amoebophrya sp. A120]|nr:unnamed protein product [Amoebophrya sp. A120]|eukprot:GSA120T00000015001.1